MVDRAIAARSLLRKAYRISFILAAAMVVGGPVALFVFLKPQDVDNASPREGARQEAAAKEMIEYRQRRHYWLEQIEAGDASFQEAACSLELHGRWDSDVDKCDKPSAPSSPNRL